MMPHFREENNAGPGGLQNYYLRLNISLPHRRLSVPNPTSNHMLNLTDMVFSCLASPRGSIVAQQNNILTVFKMMRDWNPGHRLSGNYFALLIYTMLSTYQPLL